MRPTIDDQLAGALRLLDVVTDGEELSVASAETLENVRRLLKQVARSWASLPAFYAEDNETLSALLVRTGERLPAASAGRIAAAVADADPPAIDVNASAERNADLRGLLSAALHDLPADPAGAGARAEIGDYLRRRVDLDPA